LKEIRRSVYNLKNSVLQIGFVGENDRTRVVFECKTVFDEYPSAVPSLAVKFGTTYPAIVSVDGSDVIWDVKSTDLVQEGEGEIQLTFSVGEVVAKSYIGKIAVKRSLMPSGERPDQIDDWITEANTILGSIPGTIDAALQEAKDSGDFKGDPGEDGEDGVSPIVSVADITGGHRVTITDATGSRTVDVMDGKEGDPGKPGEDGTDGISPTVSVTPITDGNQITITDKTGPHIFTVMDGKKGDKGDPGEVTQETFDELAGQVSDLNQALSAVDDKVDAIADATTDQTETVTRTDFSPAWALGVCLLDGTTGSSTGYAYTTTTEIPVQAWDKITCGDSRDVSKASMRYVTCYNGDTVQPSKGAESTTEFTVPYGVTRVVVTAGSGAMTNSYYIKRYRKTVTYSAKDQLAKYEAEEMHGWED